MGGQGAVLEPRGVEVGDQLRGGLEATEEVLVAQWPKRFIPTAF